MTFKQLAKQVFKQFEVGDRVRLIIPLLGGTSDKAKVGSLGNILRNNGRNNYIIVFHDGQAWMVLCNEIEHL